MRCHGFRQELVIRDFTRHALVEPTEHVIDLVLVQDDVGQFEDRPELGDREVALVLCVHLFESPPEIFPVTRKLKYGNQRVFS